MSRQHSNPYVVTNGASIPLERVELFKEAWLQRFIFEHCEALPIAEIEPVFGSVIPVCAELRTNAGPVDLLFINSDGLLTLVECKLWNNPEARRQVIAQILDYAKEISSWSYEELEDAIRKSSKQQVQSLYQLVASSSEELDERDFIDSVVRNLRRGRFLLLIVGSGIRESVELLTDFLQRHAHMNFSLALVEVAIFSLPREIGTGHLVLPRVVAQTTEVLRAVIRVEQGQVLAELPAEEGTRSGPKTKISEQAFYEKLAEIEPHTAQELRKFVERAKRMGLYVEPGKNYSLKLKFESEDVELNFGVFKASGVFRNYRIARVAERIGHPEIGETYLSRLAALIKGGYVQKAKNRFDWTIKKGNNEEVTIAECLAIQVKWLEIIQETIGHLHRVQEKED